MRARVNLNLARQADTGTRLQYLLEFETYLSRRGFSRSAIQNYRGLARHFLVWLKSIGATLKSIDGVTVRNFRDHSCQCPPPAGIGPRYGSDGMSKSTLKSRVSGVNHFVQFLEKTGRTEHPDEAGFCRNLLTEYLAECTVQGHTPNTIATKRAALSHFLAWLQQSRISVGNVNEDIVSLFFEHDCVCPGKFRGVAKHCRSSDYGWAIRRFVRYLVLKEILPDVFKSHQKPLCEKLSDFHDWLRRHRGVSECTILEHDRAVCTLLEHLGDDPRLYDAASVRDALLYQSRKSSLAAARRLAGSMRMYLRFLASNGDCAGSLVGAVPKFAAWKLSTLPKYIAADDVERVIESCNPKTAVGIRDRAILLLLARLGLRAGDVVKLRLSDIHWNQARLHLCGKSGQSAVLPLPQDVGDAVLDYIEKARPNVDEERVFLRVYAPHRGFARANAVTMLVRQAVKRAGVQSPGGQGAHLLRHSAATGLIRSGASLETIGALLRHQAPNTTAIYAKVDVPMLQELAQPWIGDLG